jgi:hypothetical protein
MVDSGKRPPPLKPPPISKGPPSRSSSQTAPAKPAATSSPASERPAARTSKLRWLLGWVLTPLLLLTLLFFAGAHVGARHPQMGLSRATLWVFDREPQVGPTEKDRQPMARRLRFAVLPSMDHSFEVDVTQADLEKIGKDLGVSPSTLDCATVCRALWLAKHPDREFLGITHCQGFDTNPPNPNSGKLECEAKVQR